MNFSYLTDSDFALITCNTAQAIVVSQVIVSAGEIMSHPMTQHGH